MDPFFLLKGMSKNDLHEDRLFSLFSSDLSESEHIELSGVEEGRFGRVEWELLMETEVGEQANNLALGRSVALPEKSTF